VAGGDAARADPLRGLEELVELQVIVAERAGDGRAPGQVLGDKGADDVRFKALLLVDDVVGNAQMLGDAAGVVDIIQRAAAAGLRRVRNAVLAGQPRLILKLKRQPNDSATVMGEHRRDGRGVYPSGHGYGDGFGLGHGEVSLASSILQACFYVGTCSRVTIF
jgi:hypothetical protein